MVYCECSANYYFLQNNKATYRKEVLRSKPALLRSGTRSHRGTAHMKEYRSISFYPLDFFPSRQGRLLLDN